MSAFGGKADIDDAGSVVAVTFYTYAANAKVGNFRYSPPRKLPFSCVVANWASFESLRTGVLFVLGAVSINLRVENRALYQRGFFSCISGSDLLLFLKSPEFRQLDPANTQRPRRRILEGTWTEPTEPGSMVLIGDCPVDRMSPAIVLVLRNRKASFPDAANNRLKAVRCVFKWAIENQLVASNPARDVPQLRTRADGYHTWTSEEIAQYEQHHPVGTPARLALGLLRYTGQRRGDIVRLGRPHIRDGYLVFTQNKNRNRNPVRLELPILPELQRILDASPLGQVTFLVTEYGRPFSVEGFGNKFREWCDKAGLKHCSAHGLRKAAATSLAEDGASAHQLMAWFGWKSLKEAGR